MSPPGEPSLVQVLYDSLNDIKTAVSSINEKQTALSISVATAIAQHNETSRKHEALQEKVESLENTVSDLRRTAWALTIVGGIVVAVVTSVASDWVSSRVSGPERQQVQSEQNQQKGAP